MARFGIHWSLLLLLVGGGLQPSAFAAPASKPQAQQQAGSQFEDPLVPFSPRNPVSEQQQDRSLAAAKFAYGRLLMQREKYPDALRLFQRAWRYDSSAIKILDQVVPLAFELKRNAEGARYAVISAEKNPQNPPALQQLADYLAKQNQYARAAKLYEHSLRLQKKSGEDVGASMLQLEIGRLYFIIEQYKKSSDSFDQVRQALEDPKRLASNKSLKEAVLGKADRTYSLMGESFFKAGRFDQAEAMFRKANEAKSNSAMLAFQLARLAAEKKETDNAISQLQTYFDSKQVVAGFEPYQLLEKLSSAKHSDAKQAAADSLKRLEKVHQDDPKNALLKFYLAQRYLKTKQLAKAENLYQELLASKSSDEARVGLLEVYRSKGEFEKIFAAVDKLENDLNSPLLWIELDSFSEDAAASQAVAFVQNKMKQNPDWLKSGAALFTARLALAADKVDLAEEFFLAASAASTAEDRRWMMRWGLELFMVDQYASAAKVFRHALENKLPPQEKKEVYFLLAGALEMAGQSDEGLKIVQQLIVIDSKSARYRGRESWILYHAKRYEESELSYHMLLKDFDSDHTSDDNRDAMRTARLVLSNLCVLQERTPEAVEWLEQVLDEFPEDISAMNDLGYLWADNKEHLQRALGMIQKAVTSEPENKAYRDSLGWVLYRLGRYEEALKNMELAVLEDEPDGVIFDHLGDVQSKLNHPAKALQSWQRAAEAYKKHKVKNSLKAVEHKIRAHQSKAK